MDNKKLIEGVKAFLLAYVFIIGVGYIYAVLNELIIDLTNSLWIFSIAYIGIGYLAVMFINRYTKISKTLSIVLSIFALVMAIVQSEIFLSLMFFMQTYSPIEIFKNLGSFSNVLSVLFWIPIRFGIIDTFTFNLDNMSHIIFMVISIFYTFTSASNAAQGFEVVEEYEDKSNHIDYDYVDDIENVDEH